MKTADFVIIGGGVLGCATAYYLAGLDVGRVLLLEAGCLGQGGSAQAAGVITRAHSDRATIGLVRETVDAIATLEWELGEALGFRQNGSLHAAWSFANRELLITQSRLLSDLHIDHEWITPQNARSLVPWLELPEDALVLYTPEDGFIDPYLLMKGYARAARLKGTVVCEESAVTGLRRKGARIAGVETTAGPIAAAVVIDSAGAWAGLIASQAGCTLPMAPVRSEYWITAPDPLFSPDQPLVLLPDASAYARPETGGLLFGLRGNSMAVDPRTLAKQVCSVTVDGCHGGWETLLDVGHLFMTLFRSVAEIGIAHYVAGLSTYTPDGRFALGSFLDVEGFLGAAACGNGIAASGGIGKSLAEVATELPGTIDTSSFDMSRFGRVDPLSRAFMQQCVAARDRKTGG